MSENESAYCVLIFFAAIKPPNYIAFVIYFYVEALCLFSWAFRSSFAATKLHTEIHGEIERASEQLRNSTGGRLEIHAYPKMHPLNGLGEIISSIVDPMKTISKKTPILVVGARNPVADTSPVFWANLHFSPRVLSATLSWLQESRICDDRESFKASLKEMLEDPTVAAELHKVMNALPKVIAEEPMDFESGEE